jgi:hypothetical protein
MSLSLLKSNVKLKNPFELLNKDKSLFLLYNECLSLFFVFILNDSSIPPLKFILLFILFDDTLLNKLLFLDLFK